MLMYKIKIMPLNYHVPHPWQLQDGVYVLALSPRCFFGEGYLPKIIMMASSLGKGASSIGTSSTSMTRDRDTVVMKLFIRP
jgi:hypothetical protein